MDTLRSYINANANAIPAAFEKGFSTNAIQGTSTTALPITLGVSERRVEIKYTKGIATSTVHTHFDGSPPSATDIWGLLARKQDCPNFKGKYTVGKTPANDYYVGILNTTLLKKFDSTYTKTANVDVTTSGFLTGSKIERAWKEAYLDFLNQNPDKNSNDPIKKDKAKNDADGAALAYILDTFNSGLVLYKRDINGNFVPIATVKDPYTIPQYSILTCN